MKKLLIGLTFVLLLLCSVLLVRTALFASRQIPVEPAPVLSLDEEGAAARLALALSFPTISHADFTAQKDEAFAGLHAWLPRAFPRIHATLSRELIGEHGVLFAWSGSDSSLRPALLIGHTDVVPVEPGTEGDWQHPPFAGHIADGYIWGRGAIDNKSAVFAALEAVEHLLAEGHRPVRTVFLAFGHDEEVGGGSGAREMAGLLSSRGVALEYILDEGGFVMAGSLPLSAPVALVGVAEKGYLSLELSATAQGGHSSMPPRQTAVGILSAAIVRLQDNPFPGGLRGPTRQMFDFVGPEMSFLPRMVFANTWLFGSLVERQLAATPSTDALLRTSTAPTMLWGSIKDNVLPARARAVVNFRLFPGASGEDVLQRVRRVVDDPRVEVATYGGMGIGPSPISPTDSQAFGALQRSIQQVYPDVVVAPYLMVAATDSRHFRGLTQNVYRFQPLRITQGDLSRIHGTDERVGVDDYADAIRFYRQLILNSGT